MLRIVFILSPVSIHSDSTSEEASIPPPAYRMSFTRLYFHAAQIDVDIGMPSVSASR